LLENYQDEAKIRTMITLGNLSSIGAEIGERHPYPFDKLDSPGSYTAYERTYGHMCLAYGRDRGEDDMDAIHSQSVEDFLSIQCGVEYYYIWHYGRWMVQATWGDDAGKWQLVHELLGVDLHGKSLALVIKPVNKAGSHRTGTLNDIKAAEITRILGFKSNIQDDPDKVKYSWGFEVDGKLCGIWDYKGSVRLGQFSTYGDHEALAKIFGDLYQPG
jgi:hypothetical protein